MFSNILGIHERELSELITDHHIVNSVSVLVIVFILQPMGPVANYINDYNSIHYWGSQLPEWYYGHLICRIPFVLAEFYISAVAVYGIGFYILMALLHVKALTISTRLLRYIIQVYK